MKKTRPLLVLLIAVIACLLMGSFTAFATRYTSTLDISMNSYHEGATRKYDSGVHNISMTIDHFHTRVDFGSSVDVAVKSSAGWGKSDTHVSGTLFSLV